MRRAWRTALAEVCWPYVIPSKAIKSDEFKAIFQTYIVRSWVLLEGPPGLGTLSCRACEVLVEMSEAMWTATFSPHTNRYLLSK